MAVDRLTDLLDQTALTGIDFVRVVDPGDQRILEVYFHVDPEALTPPAQRFSAQPVDPAVISITSTSGGERLARVPIANVTEAPGADGRNVLAITVEEPGDFSVYRLAIADDRIDPFFAAVEFSFKQGCPSDFDCAPTTPPCCPPRAVDFAVDYLARDFDSLRGALLAYAAERYPRWREPIEADEGTMVAELLAALGDELAYVQDRYAHETQFDTTTQRRSVRRHARLVDFTLHDGLTARTDLAVDVAAIVGGTALVAGKRVWAPAVSESGAIPFELGEGLRDRIAGSGGPRTFWVHEHWNAIPSYNPDPSVPCLPCGGTSMHVLGLFPDPADVPAGSIAAKFWIGRKIILQSDPSDPALPSRRHRVTLTAVTSLTDALTTGGPIAITRLEWGADEALPFELPIEELVVRANVVPAVAGMTHVERFVIHALPPGAISPPAEPAVERQGPFDEVASRRSITYLHSLAQTAEEGLAWTTRAEDPGEVRPIDPTPDAPLRTAEPEIELEEIDPATDAPFTPPRLWNWKRTLLDGTPQSADFTLDDGTWKRVIGFFVAGEEKVHVDYARGDGFTVRFGDGEFGRVPAQGTQFEARYRTGPGARGNLAADTVKLLTNPVTGATDLAGAVDAVTNPFPITTGVDAESLATAKELAPEAFRAVTFRAVRPADFEDMAERLSWVQRAGAATRWTGSWPTVFVTADPEGSFELSPARRASLQQQMDAVRQAGREVDVVDPEFVNLDLEVCLCVAPSAYPGQVEEAVVRALTGPWPRREGPPFFHPDRFTFGTPLSRSALEAAIQDVPGVEGVQGLCIRARGYGPLHSFDELVFEPGKGRVLRLENDPRFPERGSLSVHSRGACPTCC
jgi:hypothetical protein